MGVPGSANLLLAGAEAEAYEIEYSLRYKDNTAYMTAPSNGTATSSTVSSWSFWWKKTDPFTNNIIMWSEGGGNTQQGFSLNSNPYTIRYVYGTTTYATTTGEVTDPTAWYHFFARKSGSTIQIYINGELWASGTSAPTTSWTESGYQYRIGYSDGGNRMSGYIAEMHIVDGTYCDVTDFGEYSSDTGAWIPKEYSGSYGNNGAYYKFDPTASNGIYHDHSGNGKHITNYSGFTTTGETTDVFKDTPTNNFCVLNNNTAADTNSLAENGGLEHEMPGSVPMLFGSIGVKSGKWYWEGYAVGGMQNGTVGGRFGLCSFERNSGTNGNVNAERLQWQVSVHATNGLERFEDGSYTSIGGSHGISDGEYWALALDADSNIAYFYENNVLRYTHDFSSQVPVGSAFLGPISWNASSGTPHWRWNFGGSNAGFKYTPPTGYKALCTANLTDPTITDPGQYFNAITYTGNGSTQSITGVGFQPDLVWIKSITVNGHDHVLTDSARGTSKVLRSNVTNAEYTQTDAITSFDSDGFSLGDDNSVGQAGNFNTSSYSRIAWCWKEGSTPGFDIVTYTGTGSARTISHNLGVKPRLIIIFRRNSADNHYVYHGGLGATQYGQLNSDTAFSDFNNAVVWNQTEPTSSVFSVGTVSEVNASGSTYVAYVFAEVEGFSKFGVYTGNGNEARGIFCHTGFRPNLVVVKRTDAGNNWHVYDSTRSPVNLIKKKLYWDTAGNQEDDGYNMIRFMSNGFKLNGDTNGNNGSGNQYLYMAFAAHPFKYATAF